MNKLFVTVGQIAIGVFVGRAASDVVNGAVKKVKEVVESKKKEAGA